MRNGGAKSYRGNARRTQGTDLCGNEQSRRYRTGEMAKAFKEKTEELSGGTLIIDIQANGVLGSEDQLIDNLLVGGNITDFTRISASALTQYGCSKAALLSIPYTFESD